MYDPYSHSLLQTLEAEKNCVQRYLHLNNVYETGGYYDSAGPKPVFCPMNEAQKERTLTQLQSLKRAIDSHRETIKSYFNPQ